MTLATFDGRKIALRELDANRLRELVDHAGIDVLDRRAREGMIQALADARRVDFSTLVGKLSRDELKAMCRALGLSDEGRDKSTLVSRLMTGDVNGQTELWPTGPETSRPWRARVAQLLKRDELLDIADKIEIEVADRRVHKQLAATVAATDVSLSTLLENLPRVRLKELCRELGLDDGGREKSALLQRIAERDEPLEDEEDEEDDAPIATEGPELVAEVLAGHLTVHDPGTFWPARSTLTVDGVPVPVDLHARIVGPTGRNPLERRIQNPVKSGAVTATQGRLCLLMGLWVEQGHDRAVLVSFDPYRRLGKTTRFSLFVPLSVLEEAADVGFASHVNGRRETIYAFRPDSIDRFLDVVADAGPEQRTLLRAWRTRPKAARASVRPEAGPTVDEGTIEIRPRAGMFAAFARLNYKPWFALAEFVDNSIQSFLSHRDALVAAGSTGPLVVDIHIDDDQISVTDRAAGIRLEDFPRAFSPATPPHDPSGLSEFGLGMKAAACWFADEWSVRTSTIEEDIERTISFDVPKITREGLDYLPVETAPGRPRDHFTVITMRRLRVKPRGSTLNKVKEHLASIYRLLIADGTVRIRVTASGKSEELAYEHPKILVAPYYAKPNGPPVVWRTDIDIDLGGGRRVTGWAGLMEKGKQSRAGFAVFRRKRLIEGSVGEAWRPRQVFGAENTFASQRLFGELYVEGFEVSHTKDGIHWGEDADGIAYDLRVQLDRDEAPLLDQANGYRARRTAAGLPPDFGREAVVATAASAAALHIAASKLPDPAASEESEPTALKPTDSALQQRAFRMVVDGDQQWDVRLELVREPGAEWLESRRAQVDGRDQLQIRINLDHAFSEEHLNDNERAPCVRIVAASRDDVSGAQRQRRWWSTARHFAHGWFSG
ncbi:MAG: ATP-binding protein [Polyangiales bacterium]